MATIAALVVGAKSWLDEERMRMRRDYAAELSAFHESAAQSVCLPMENVVDSAMARGWQVREVPAICGTSAMVRLIPSTPAPWIHGTKGFVMGFDGAGCRVVLPDGCEP